MVNHRDTPDDAIELQLRSLLSATIERGEAGPLPGQAAALAQFRAHVRQKTAQGRRRHRLRATVAGIAAAFSLSAVGVAAAAATGSLPDSAQDLAHRWLDELGIDVPAPDQPATPVELKPHEQAPTLDVPSVRPTPKPNRPIQESPPQPTVSATPSPQPGTTSPSPVPLPSPSTTPTEAPTPPPTPIPTSAPTPTPSSTPSSAPVRPTAEPPSEPAPVPPVSSSPAPSPSTDPAPTPEHDASNTTHPPSPR